ncbi:MAG: glycosyltransferase family 4 protein [Ferrimicrobium sp.]|jgi:glycosyltransferase involved in cell wall biosynthesis|nr:glycosyltransferase family 4 protein [Ferrimicrobium sp.]
MTPPWRIGFVGTELAPLTASAGGLERLVVGWATALNERHRSMCFSRYDHTSPVTTKPGDNLAKLLRGCDVAVINNRPEWANALDMPVVLILHNTAEAWGLPGCDAASQPVAPPVTMGDHVVVLAVSAFLASHAKTELHLPALPRVLPPFIDPAFIDPAFIDPAFGSAPRWHPNNNALLFPNRLLAKKGVLETLAAIERVADPSVRVVFLENFAPWTHPTDEHQELLSQLRACTRCSLEPRIAKSRALATRMLASSAILAPSTRPEGLGLVPLEALALGIPTIISAQGGLAELARYGAMIVEPSDTAAFAHAIETVTRRDPSSRNLSIDHDGIRADYSLERSVSILEAAMSEAIGR